MVKYAIALGAAVALQAAAAAHTRDVGTPAYPPSDVCHPQGVVTWDTTYPPCLSQGEVEGQCAPASDDATGWAAQRDCMCDGSFFDDAVGCSKCKQCNALQTHEESQGWDTLFAGIWVKYCQGTPTAAFSAYWSAAIATGTPLPRIGDERDRCVEAGDAVVEHYYSATKTQGPGRAKPTATAADATRAEAIETAVADEKPAAPAVGSNTKADRVVLHAAATVRQTVAVITAAPLLSGPKFPLANASVPAVGVETNVNLTFAMAAMNCHAAFVDGCVVPSCDAAKLIEGSDKMVPEAARAGAVDFGACTCASKFLAPKKLRPVVASVDVQASTKVSVYPVARVFGPAGADKHKSKVLCPTDAPANKPTDKLAADAYPADDEAEADDEVDHHQVKPLTDAGHEQADAPVSTASPAGNKALSPVGAASPDGDEAAPAGKTAPVPAGKADNAAKNVTVPARPTPVTAGPKGHPVTAGARSAGVSAAVMAVAFAVYVL